MAITIGPQASDATATYPLTLASTYAGTEPLSAELWAEGGPTLAVPAVAWTNPTAKSIALTVAAADLAGLPEGLYNVRILVTSGGQPTEGLTATLSVADAPGGPYVPTTPPNLVTRAKVEKLLIGRVGGIFTRVGLDGATYHGDNGSLLGAISYAILECGYPIADPFTVTDADLVPLVQGSLNKLLDIAELRCLETAIGYCGDVGVLERIKMHEVDPEHFLRTLMDNLARKQKIVYQRYYSGGQRVYSGPIHPVGFRGFLARPPQWGISTIEP